MNGSHRRDNVRSSKWSSRPHFFKIITSGADQQQKLRIPIKFVRGYGETLSNPVFLKVPNGEVWQVELTNSEGHFWLQNGWKEFTEYYSIGFGHFLVFKYNGNSHFHLLIFDTTASEIEYPLRTSPGEQTNLNEDFQMPATEGIEGDDFQAWHTKVVTNIMPNREEIEKDVSVEILKGSVEMENYEKVEILKGSVEMENYEKVEILNHPPTSPIWNRERRMNSIPAASDVPSCRFMRTNEKRNTQNASHLQDLLGDFPPGNVSREVKLKISNADAKPYPLEPELQKKCSRGMPTADQKFRVLERAKAFKSKNPFFKVQMQPSYVCEGRVDLYIPLAFAKKYLSRRKINVTLRISDGRTWSAKCSCCQRSSTRYKLSWNSFLQDNNVKVGDVCVFEMIKSASDESLFNVIIFRAVEY